MLELGSAALAARQSRETPFGRRSSARTMTVSVPLLVVLLLAWRQPRGAAAVASSPRLEIPFDFGWRFHLGTPGNGSKFCSDRGSVYTVQLNDVQCTGLSANQQAVTADLCEAAACANRATTWQFCADSKCKAPCFFGNIPYIKQCTRPDGRFVGAGRALDTWPLDTAPAATNFNDSSFYIVDTPHDALIATPYSNSSYNGEASLPRNVTWYRKHFVLPIAWSDSHVSVYFDGAYAVTHAWLNGVPVANHSCGYTSFALRLDNVTGVKWGEPNVLALFVDATPYTGWWYEGGGLYRNVRLVRTARTRIQDDSVFAPAYVEGPIHTRGRSAEGLTATNASIAPRVVVENYGSQAEQRVRVLFQVLAADGQGAVVESSETVTSSISRGGSQTLAAAPIRITDAELWSVPRPYLYRLVTTVIDDQSGRVLDVVNSSIGVRSVRFDAEQGLFLNEQHVKIRGFCNHNSFTGVGMGVPLRINLFRMQQLRGLGANSWRMSHSTLISTQFLLAQLRAASPSDTMFETGPGLVGVARTDPGTPSLYSLADRLGVTILNENRVRSETNDLPGPDLTDLQDMVRRDRGHASVLYWSFCNENQCSPSTEPTLSFKLAVDDLDGSRAVTANMFWAQVNRSTNATDILDVQGFSHQSRQQLTEFHSLRPSKPVLATECCGCKSQRMEDGDLYRNLSTAYYDSTGLPNPHCVQHHQWLDAYAPQWSAGLYTWTLHDYYGEPNGWPHVSSSHGQIDLAGFPKAASYWYRSQYLSAVAQSDPGRPPLTQPAAINTCHIVETWQPPSNHSGRTIHVYTNAPFIRLSVNGAFVGIERANSSWALFYDVNYEPGTLTAHALGSDKQTILGTHSRHSFGAPARLELSLDVPSDATATGSALYLDGSDVALVRATVVDAQGHHVVNSVVNISFAVTAPGRIVAAGNGDPASHEPNRAPWHTAYHGLVRGIVQVSVDATDADPATAALRREIELDAGKEGQSSIVLASGATVPTEMVVSATSPGLPSAQLKIPLSVDPADAPMAVAARSVLTAALQ